MSQMLKSSSAIGAATLTSRLLGLVREIVYSRFMGDTWVAGAFTFAFMVPNLFRRLLGEGALTAAFIPIFKERGHQAGEAAMWQAANAVISGLITVTAGLVGVAVTILSVLLLLPWQEAKTVLMLDLLRLMFPYLLFVSVAAVFMGILNARGHFFVPALGAALLNVALIASVLWLAPHMGARLDQRIYALGFGVLVAGAVQAFFQLPLLRREGYRFAWVSPWRDETVGRVVKLMIPGILGVAAYQFNVLIIQSLAYWVDPGMVKSFDYAVRLMELPQGLFGISLATYLLPTLSGFAAEKNYRLFRSTLGQGTGYLLFLNLLAAALLVVLAGPIVRLLFQGGIFDEAATARASSALVTLAPGLVAFSLVNIFARAFYALGDTATPMRISVCCLLLNVVISMALIMPFRQAGLGAANTLSSAVNVTLLVYALRRKLTRLDFGGLRRTIPQLLTAMIVAGAIAWALARWWEQSLGHASLVLRTGHVFVPALAAALFYFGAAFWLRIPFLDDLLLLLPARIFRRIPRRDSNG